VEKDAPKRINFRESIKRESEREPKKIIQKNIHVVDVIKS
jgi:hypothetical protein